MQKEKLNVSHKMNAIIMTEQLVQVEKAIFTFKILTHQRCRTFALHCSTKWYALPLPNFRIPPLWQNICNLDFYHYSMGHHLELLLFRYNIPDVPKEVSTFVRI